MKPRRVQNNDIQISTSVHTVSFRFFTDEQLLYTDEWQGTINKNKINSINELIGNTAPSSAGYSFEYPYKSGFLNFSSIRNVYISSSNLGTLNVIGPRGSSCSILKKVPVSSDYGFLILDQNSVAHDYVDVSRQTMKSLEFRLEDVYGNLINLHNSPVSFSLIFETVSNEM